MKRIAIVLFFLSFQSIIGQNNTEFNVEIIIKEKSEYAALTKSFSTDSELIYEDEEYSVFKYCKGEFGGGIRFFQKKTNSSYVAKATCPSSIIRKNGTYYLTTSLSHLSGLSGFYEIKDPSKLRKIDASKNNLSESFDTDLVQLGMNSIWKNSGTVLLTFLHKSDFYFITSNDKNVILQKLDNGEMITVKVILNKRLYHVYNDSKISVSQQQMNRFLYFDDIEMHPGIISVNENNIKVYLF